MSELRSHYDVKLVREPSGDEISLEVAPGTPSADIVDRAASAGMYHALELDRDDFDQAAQNKIRQPIMALRAANRHVVGRRGERHNPVMFRGDAAAAVLDGLVALSLDAEEAQQQIDQGTSPAMREALRIDAAHRAEVAHQAEIIQGEVLEQATKMGQAVVNSVAMPPAIR
jgi:hypothetical protein